MTVEQAINVFEQVRRKFQGTGDDHDLLKQAIETLAKNVSGSNPQVREQGPQVVQMPKLEEVTE